MTSCPPDVRIATHHDTRVSHCVALADRSGPPREDLPLPTEPPYTAFVGNLAFDLTDIDLEEFFAGHQVSGVGVLVD